MYVCAIYNNYLSLMSLWETLIFFLKKIVLVLLCLEVSLILILVD